MKSCGFAFEQRKIIDSINLRIRNKKIEFRFIHQKLKTIYNIFHVVKPLRNTEMELKMLKVVVQNVDEKHKIHNFSDVNREKLKMKIRNQCLTIFMLNC